MEMWDDLLVGIYDEDLDEKEEEEQVEKQMDKCWWKGCGGDASGKTDGDGDNGLNFLIRRQSEDSFTTFKSAKSFHRRSKKVIDPRTGTDKVTIHVKPVDVVQKVKIPLQLPVLLINFV
ncbi:hypothetical protein L1987_53163 [Smallanthus sonchifolius]|uniref:Uncharacterized protein n=1 Tax=Smallanthus sonchifolius TaxID=185202 RepID=A0ACB9EV50_9ASTR|nr:hypothetical protein L1987_53163 [Smallanthus sonchifolius]